MNMTKILSACLILAVSVFASNCTQTRAKLSRIHFDYDKSYIRNDMMPVLDKNVSELKRDKNKNVVLEGHADERGSNEYNYALGARRASSVKSYLVSHGVSGSRLTTISYGEDKPLERGHNEQAWYQNRRVEFK